MTFVATAAAQRFYASSDAQWAREQLQGMVENCAYNTPAEPFYVHTIEPGKANFVEQHMTYLCEHPKIRVQDYLSNLRLKTRIR